MRFVGRVHRAEDVDVHLVLTQMPPAAHHAVERALPAAVAPIGVVEIARAVNAQADEEVVLLEEGAPLVVEQDAVGLERVLHDLARPTVSLDEVDRAPEEVELHQRRLAALPRHRHLGCAMRFQQLTDVGLEGRIRHPVRVVGIERFLREKEAVRAVDVAGRPAWFREQVESRRRACHVHFLRSHTSLEAFEPHSPATTRHVMAPLVAQLCGSGKPTVTPRHATNR